MFHTGWPRNAKTFDRRPLGPRTPMLKTSPDWSFARNRTSTTIVNVPDSRRAETRFSRAIDKMTCPGATSNAATFWPSTVAAHRYPKRFSDRPVQGSSPTSAEVRSYIPAARSRWFTMGSTYPNWQGEARRNDESAAGEVRSVDWEPLRAMNGRTVDDILDYVVPREHPPTPTPFATPNRPKSSLLDANRELIGERRRVCQFWDIAPHRADDGRAPLRIFKDAFITHECFAPQTSSSTTSSSRNFTVVPITGTLTSCWLMLTIFTGGNSSAILLSSVSASSYPRPRTVTACCSTMGMFEGIAS